MKKNLLYLYLLFGLSACIPAPDFPLKPEIAFLSIRNTPFPSRNIDSVYLRITIKDGDGDLGLSGKETDPKYAPTILKDGQKVPNKYASNYFIDIKKKENGVFKDVKFLDGATFNGRFPRLQEERGALEVKLNYAFELFVGNGSMPLNKGDEVIFEIHIADRALRESNKIKTLPIILGTPSK